VEGNEQNFRRLAKKLTNLYNKINRCFQKTDLVDSCINFMNLLTKFNEVKFIDPCSSYRTFVVSTLEDFQHCLMITVAFTSYKLSPIVASFNINGGNENILECL